MTYTGLQTEVANYLHRTDLTAQIQMFITLAESYLFRELHIKEMEISVAGTTTGGYITLPADFGTVSRITVTYSGYEHNLDYKAQADYSTTVEVFPQYFSLEKNKLRIWGAGDSQAYTLYYVPDIPNLSASVATNWIMDNAFELYLYASCLEGAKYIRDDAQVASLSAQVATSIDSVKRFAERRGQPATGSMQIKPRRRG